MQEQLSPTQGDEKEVQPTPRGEESGTKAPQTPARKPTPLPRLGPGTRVLQPRKLRSIAIIALGGTAAQWPGMWPLWKEVEEVWTINMGCFGVRSDLNFSCHTLATMLGVEDPKWTDEHADLAKNIESNKKLVEMLAASKIPQVTLDGAYGSYEYPFAEVVAKYGQGYFMNGLAYMIAFALYSKIKTIYAYGWEFEAGPKAMEQGRASVEYWVAYAAAKGMRFAFPKNTTFLDIEKRSRMGIYGFGHEQPFFDKKSKATGFQCLDSASSRRLQAMPLWRKLNPFLRAKSETEPSVEPCP